MTAVDTEEKTTLTMTAASYQDTSVSAAVRIAQTLLDEADSCFSSDTSRSLRLSRQALSAVPPPSPADDSSLQLWTLLKSRAHRSLARCLERQSHFEEALSQSEKARELLEGLRGENHPVTPEFVSAYSDALHIIGNANQRLGRHFDALNCYQTELRFLETMGARKEQVAVRNAIAAVAYHIGDYGSSIQSALEALSIARETGHHRGHGSALNTLGNIYFKRGDYSAALDSYDRSLDVFTYLEDRYWQAGLIGNYANVCLKIGDRERALEMHTSSLRLREVIEDRQGQAHSLLDLGSLYAGRYESGSEETVIPEDVRPALALRYYRKSLRLFQQVGDKQGVASCLIRIGNLYGTSVRVHRALPYGYRALAIAEEAGIREHIYEAHCLLSDVHERLGDFASALKHHKQFHAVKEAVFSSENEERVRNLEVIHRVAQAKQDTDTQKRLSERLSITVKALRASDSEKAHLLIKLREQATLLERQVRTDALTGLLNRRTLDCHLQEEWERARRDESAFCIVICDADHFKQINDHFSHQIGDAVLREIALAFQKNLRETDVVARYGGEEFVFILRDTPLEEARRICEVIRVSVNTNEWDLIHTGLKVSVSMGIHEVAGTVLDGSPEQALRSADAALYQAKRLGRNRVCPDALAA